MHYNTQEIGDHAEDTACKFLQAQGMKLLEKNYCCRFGEIDLILEDREDIVFVEVRCRSNIEYGNALESITCSKRNKLIRTALCYLQATKYLYTRVSRFDIVAIHPCAGKVQLEWIKNAFTNDHW